jgi:hypothetical protein
MKKFIPLLSLCLFLISSLQASSLNTPLSDDTTASYVLTEDNQGSSEENPITIPCHSELDVTLLGSHSDSIVYSSGSGSYHGERWTLNPSAENDCLKVLEASTSIDPPDSPRTLEEYLKQHRGFGWHTKTISYHWKFSPEKTGLYHLTFKKYYYSDSTARNLDGSSLWKDPIQEIDFTILIQ